MEFHWFLAAICMEGATLDVQHPGSYSEAASKLSQIQPEAAESSQTIVQSPTRTCYQLLRTCCALLISSLHANVSTMVIDA